MPINSTRLVSLLIAGESRTVEFKESKAVLPKTLFESISAFLNRDGGDIVLGVKDDGTVVGIDRDLIQKLKRDFVNLTNDSTTLAPPCYLSIDELVYNDKILLHIYVPPGSQVHRAKGKIFDRNEDGDYDITNNQAEVAKLYIRKQETYTENRIYDYLSIDDLRSDLIERVRKRASIHQPGHVWENLTNIELLKSARLFKNDRVRRVEGPTLAAVLLFGSDDLILDILPHHKTDAICRRYNIDRYDDRDDIRTNLLDSYDRLIAFGEKHLNDAFFLEGVQRVSVRSLILREIISNLLIHREYSYAYPAKFVIENDRIFTENGNRPHGFGYINPVHFTPFPKNPTIARVFKEIGFADELGSGVRRLFKYCQAFTGADPILDEQDCFRFILPVNSENARVNPENARVNPENAGVNSENASVNLEDAGENSEYDDVENQKTSERIMQIMLEKPLITYKGIAQIIGRSKSAVERAGRKLQDQGKIRRIGGDKGGHWEICQ